MSATSCTVQDHNQDTSENTTSDLRDEIRMRAYEIFEQRGRHDGFAEEDWLQAEAEILARANALSKERFSTTTRERANALMASRRQEALNRAARWAQKARPNHVDM